MARPPRVLPENTLNRRDVEKRLRAVESVYVHPETARSAYDLTPRGIVKQFTASTNNPTSASHTTDTVSDMVINNVPWVTGRRYEIHLHTQYLWESLGAAARWVVTFRVNAVAVDRFWSIQPGVAGTISQEIDAKVFYTPTTDAGTDDIDVYLDEITDGANLTLQGASGVSRTLTVTDIGVLLP